MVLLRTRMFGISAGCDDYRELDRFVALGFGEITNSRLYRAVIVASWNWLPTLHYQTDEGGPFVDSARWTGRFIRLVGFRWHRNFEISYWRGAA